MEVSRRLDRPLPTNRDFIMEKNVGELVEQLVEQECAIEQIIDALSRTYEATAQVCNVMASFLVELGDQKPPKRRRKKIKREVGDDLEEPELYNGKLEAEKSVEDALSFLLTKNFSPDVADSIFEDRKIGIDWLPSLISHKRWRDVLYNLVEHHPQCLMLNFAVKLISDAGYQPALGSVNSAAQQLDIYSRVFLTSLDAALEKRQHGASSEVFLNSFNELVGSCYYFFFLNQRFSIRIVAQGEHTYIYAFMLLKYVKESQTGWMEAACEYLAEELRLAISKRHLHETTALRLAHTRGSSEQISAYLSQAMLTMTSKQELNPADTTLVYDNYIMPCPPPIELIREPLFLTLLLDALFHCDGPKVPIDDEHRDQYIYLLAYSASVSEKSSGGDRTQVRGDLDDCRLELERAVALLECDEDLVILMDPLMKCCRVRVVASGILYFAHSLLMTEARIGDVSLAAFVLLDQVATLHANLHSSLFNVWCDYYDKVSSEPDVAEVIMVRQRVIIDRLVHLLSVGAAVLVIERVSSMLDDTAIDPSLVRYFLTEVLEIISPPYSPQLIGLLLPLVSNSEVFDRTLLEKCPQAAEFIEHCGRK